MQETTTVLDRATALDRLGLEGDLFEELVNSLLERSTDMAAEIARALERGDRTTVEMVSHSIKGAASMLEANALAAAAQRLEMAARFDRMQEAPAAWRELSTALADLARAVAGGAAAEARPTGTRGA